MGDELFFSIRPAADPSLLPVQVLAYLGDAVYELLVRQYLVGLGMSRVDVLHKEAVRYVRADFQAKAIRRLEGVLSEEERAVARRGRNTKLLRPSKGQAAEACHYSTALEALVGFLYLKGERRRLAELMEMVLQQGGDLS